MKLRPYQQEARKAIENEWREGRRRTLLVLPTGCGKTVVFCSVAADCADAGERVLILAHRGELLEQAADKMEKLTGMQCALEKAESTSIGSMFPVTVGSVQTMMQQSRLDRFPHDHFDTIIIDEAHHSLSDSYRRILDHFSSAKVLGVTATADRGDKKSLGEIFDSIAYEYTMPEAMHEGYLCRIKAQMLPVNIDMSGVRVSEGDFSAGDLGDTLEPYLEGIADSMRDAGCMERKTVVFLPLVATSKRFAQMLSERGFDAMEVDGDSADRAETLARYDAAGPGAALCNSMLLTEGWDCPSVDCIVVLRPTKVRSLYVQMVGRGTRPSPATGKKDLLLLDFLWMTGRHELCRPANLIAKTPETAQRMTEISEGTHEARDLEECESQAERDIVAEREASLAEQLKQNSRSKSRLVDPIEFEMSLNAEDLISYEPTFEWEFKPPTEKQIAFIERSGIDASSIPTRGMASALMDRIIKRSKSKLATPKQIRFLRKKGFMDSEMWQKEEAKAVIDRIAENGWMVPWDIDPATYRPDSQRGETA